MKQNRVYFENGKVKRDNVVYIMPPMPDDFKILADAFFDEMRRIAERVRDGAEKRS